VVWTRTSDSGFPLQWNAINVGLCGLVHTPTLGGTVVLRVMIMFSKV
jgi:hypothetical protein